MLVKVDPKSEFLESNIKKALEHFKNRHKEEKEKIEKENRDLNWFVRKFVVSFEINSVFVFNVLDTQELLNNIQRARRQNVDSIFLSERELCIVDLGSQLK